MPVSPRFLEGAGCLVLRQADDDGLKAEAGEVAEEDDQHPDEDEDAVFVFAHHARASTICARKARAALTMRIRKR